MIEIEGKYGWIIGGGGRGRGAKGMFAPPSQIIGGPAPPSLSLPTPMCQNIYSVIPDYAYITNSKKVDN